jgi:hypothetical protein
MTDDALHALERKVSLKLEQRILEGDPLGRCLCKNRK